MTVVSGGFRQTNLNVTASVTLNGGVLSVNALILRTGVIDITAGTLIIDGDVMANVDAWVIAGLIVADGGAGIITATFDGTQTTIIAVPEPEPKSFGLIG